MQRLFLFEYVPRTASIDDDQTIECACDEIPWAVRQTAVGSKGKRIQVKVEAGLSRVVYIENTC